MRAYYTRLMSPVGTIEDALMMCDKMCWWSGDGERAPYIFRTAWAFDYDDEGPTYKTICDVRRDYEWHPTHDVILFRYGTPDFVSKFLAARGDERLITHVVQLAVRASYSSDAMFRLINIADALIDYGFEFDDFSICMAVCLRGHGRHLIRKMVNILRIEDDSLPPPYTKYVRAFQHTGLEAWLLNRLPTDAVDKVIYFFHF